MNKSIMMGRVVNEQIYATHRQRMENLPSQTFAWR